MFLAMWSNVTWGEALWNEGAEPLSLGFVQTFRPLMGSVPYRAIG